MTKLEKGSFTSRETETRKLAYDEDFRAWMKEHPRAMKTFLEIVHSHEFKNAKEGDVFERGEIMVTAIGQHSYRGPRLKLELAGSNFFVKIEKESQEQGFAWGHKEFVDSQKAKELLAGLSGVEVYESQLGYQTEKESFFVSKWIDLPGIQEYMDMLIDNDEEGNEEKVFELRKKNREIHEVLKDFFDINDYNMFYDPQTDKIILFDISRPPMGIYIDDTRTPDDPEYNATVRNFREFKALIERAEASGEVIGKISFDNDLGEGESQGWEILKWLADKYPKYFDGRTELKVHSANPVAREKMQEFIKYCRKNKEALAKAKKRPYPLDEIETK